MPKIINKFLETYDLSGKTIMPFCTSGGSGIATSVSAIKSICPNADVKDGLRGSSSTTASQLNDWFSEAGNRFSPLASGISVVSWINGLNLNNIKM